MGEHAYDVNSQNQIATLLILKNIVVQFGSQTISQIVARVDHRLS